jgi:hypothetical protein
VKNKVFIFYNENQLEQSSRAPATEDTDNSQQKHQVQAMFNKSLVTQICQYLHKMAFLLAAIKDYLYKGQTGGLLSSHNVLSSK